MADSAEPDLGIASCGCGPANIADSNFKQQQQMNSVIDHLQDINTLTKGVPFGRVISDHWRVTLIGTLMIVRSAERKPTRI